MGPQDKMYRAVAQQRSQMLRDNRHSGLEEAIHGVEHAIKYPNILTPRSAYLSFWEKRVFQVEIFFFISIAITYMLVSLMFCAIRRMRDKTDKKLKVL